MSVDHLQLQVVDTIYNDQVWLYELLSGPSNDVYDALEDFNTALENIVGLTKEGVVVLSTDTSGYDNMQWETRNPVYGGANYLTGINATNLRNDTITQLATITNLQGYKDVAIRSYRNDLIDSDGYSFGTGDQSEGLEIFVSGCKFQTVEYVEPSNIDTLLSRVNDALDTIAGLEFSGIVSSSTRATVDNLFIGVDDTTFNGNKYLSLANATTIRNAIINALSSVTDLDTTTMEVEIRISKKDNLASD